MNIQFKQILKAFTFLFIISFISCEKDLYEDNIKDSSKNIKVSHISLNDLDKIISSKINERISMIKKLNVEKNKIQNKIEYNSSLDLYIDTENGTLINNNGEISYTFPIFRESENNLENIIFKSTITGEIETYIAKYNVTPEEFLNLTYDEISTLDQELQKATASGWYIICVDTQIQTGVSAPLDNGDLTGNFGYQTIWQTTGTTCYFIDNSGSSPNYSPIVISNNPASNGGGGATTTVGVSTSPGTSPDLLNIKVFIKALPDDLENHYSQNPDAQESINNFLLINNSTQESQEVIIEILQASIQNNIPLIKLIRVVDQLTKPCQAKIILRSILLNSDYNELIKNSLIFPNDTGVYFNDLPSSEMPLSTIGAFTVKEPYYLEAPDTGYVIGITFNTNYLTTATDLGIVVLSYHELLHAYFIDLYHQGNLLVQYPGYTDLNDAFTNYYLNSNIATAAALDNELHDKFVDFIDPIAQAIVNYCQTNGINGVNLDYAKKLVWGSLYGTSTFTENLTEAEELEAQTLIAYENYNYPSAKGTKTCN